MIYSLSEGDITKARWIEENVTVDEALDWIDLNNFEMWRTNKLVRDANH